MTIEKARQLRSMIVKASASLSDPDAVRAAELFPRWNGLGTSYIAGDRVQYDGSLWRCLTSHSAQTDWRPGEAPALWVRVLIPDPEVIPDWEQPDSTNPYATGDKVRHNGKLWISTLDGNIWEPGVYGWEEYS